MCSNVHIVGSDPDVCINLMGEEKKWIELMHLYFDVDSGRIVMELTLMYYRTRTFKV